MASPFSRLRDRFFVGLWIVALAGVAACDAGGSNSEGQRGAGGSREVIRIVGSSTVFPFTTAVAENFGAKTGFSTPVVEATGTGGGMNLFCSGVGQQHPDVTGASRPMKASEFQLCQDNGVTDITEILIGFDGIVLGNAVTGPQINLDKRELFLALVAEAPAPVDEAGEFLVDENGALLPGRSFSQTAGYSCARFTDNPFQRWSDINSDLPDARIEVFGPPPTSGTRDAFVELGMHLGARRIACLEALHVSDEGRFEDLASRIREDGGWVDAGENDNTIIQTLANSPSSFGVFGYSFLEQNGDRIQGATITGVPPQYELIASGEYPISRSLFVYLKNQHVGVVPGMAEFVEELTSEDSWGPFGYLAERGLVALPDATRPDAREAALALTAMQDAEG
ncbi:MAG: substrate-binding domain-containing protein [Pseudomonadota bacterium]